MAISKMKKLTLAIVDSVRDQLLKELQALGAVHIDSLKVETSNEENIRVEAWTEGLGTISSDISALEDQRKELASAINRIKELFSINAPEFEVTSSDVIQKTIAKYDILQLAEQLKVLDRRTRENDTIVATLNLELQQVQAWSSGVDEMSPIHGTSSVLKGVVGQIPESSFDAFYTTITDSLDLADVVSCWVQDKEVYCYVVSNPSVWEEVNNILKGFPFNTLQITRRTGLLEDIISALKSEILSAQQKHDIAIKEWEYFSTKLNHLTLLHDSLEMDIQQLKASSFALATEKVNFFRAWVPEDYMPKVEAILSIHEKYIDVTIEDPSEEEYSEVPVLLKNNALTRPFAALTSMYGTPMYGHTVDPTPHLSIFYFIFYGICLGDALYGVLLAGYSVFMMFKNRANQSMSNFFALLAWSGLSAMIAGIIFGSYAGDLFSKYIPIPLLTDLRFTFNDGSSFFDKPLFVLFVSLFLGAIQLWYGYWIKFFVSLKNKGVEAFFQEMPWIILLGGFFGWAVFSWIGGMAGLTLVSAETVNLFFLAMKIGAGLIILNNIRMGFQKSVVGGIIGPLAGAWELYSISGYLSNLLSYARLLALGLSSGIIANVFNQLGYGVIEGLSSITPFLGIFGVIMLIFLHLFNLVLGGFGAFVHALRLQFVEFFGQFIEGGGKDFSPLICKGTHYTIK
ncbi:MAG: V-type ATP synthase subunit I [Spirochaetota bacterium]|nr:V-type ATP synthase subunit I [Spirochaetota bacterium]